LLGSYKIETGNVTGDAKDSEDMRSIPKTFPNPAEKNLYKLEK
jgi:hypothetical protein